MAPFSGAVVLVCVQITLPLPLFQNMLVVVSVSQPPLAGSIVAPLLVLPASQINCAASTLAVQKIATATASKWQSSAEEKPVLFNVVFIDVPWLMAC